MLYTSAFSALTCLSPMWRRFSPHTFLECKMNEVSFDEIQDYFKIHNRTVGAYVCNEFCGMCCEKPTVYQYRGISVILDNAASLLPKALENATQESSCLETNEMFLDDLLRKMQSNRRILSAACSHPAFCDDAMVADVLSIVIPKFTDQVNCHNLLQCSRLDYSPLYVIDEKETDSFFHIGNILRRLLSILKLNEPIGLVVLCYSKLVAVALHIFTIMVDKCSPPGNLFSFIPAIAQQSQETILPFGQTLSIIFYSSDMEAAVKNSLSLMCSRSSKFRSSIVLLEEAAESKFYKKLGHLLNNKYQINSSESSNFVQSLQKDFGAALFNNGDSAGAPWIVYDLSPSALAGDALWNAGDVSFIMRFRTAKEAHLIASHFISRFQFEQRRILDSCSYADLAVNLWLNSTALPWQLGLALAESGAQSIFVNTPVTRLLSSMYVCGSGIYGDASPSPIRGYTEHDHIERRMELSDILQTAFRAQKAWSSQGLCGIKCNVFRNVRQLTCISDAADRAWSLFLRLSNDFTGGLESFDYKGEVNSVDNSPILSHQWLMPMGPVIFILTKDLATHAAVSQSLLQTILQALFSGNAVVVIALQDSIESILPCHASLSSISTVFPANLITVKSYQDLSFDELKGIFNSIRHPGVFVDAKVIWNSPKWARYQRCLYFSSRKIIHLSTDGGLFSY